jgi:glycosyltransferase involved in cell wall biosynthesis
MKMGSFAVGLDFRPALSRATGVGRYFQGLVSGLARVDSESTYVLFSSSLKERPRREERPPNFHLVDRRVPVRALNLLWHRFGTPSFETLVGRSVDVVHSPTPLLVPSRRARSIVTIHDLFFLDRPAAIRAEIRRDYAALAREHARRADAILAVSETTARDAAERLDVRDDRITVIHPGVDERFRDGSATADGEPPRSPYLLTVATQEPRKNLPRLLEAIAILVRRGWDGRLVIAGGPGLDTREVDERIERFGLHAKVEKLGYVDSARLPALYRRARGLVLASLWEGFGLPLLEAMASGTPVVASDIPVHREVAGDAALFVPSSDPDAIAGGIERLWSDESLRSGLVTAGRERVARFSWECSARKAIDLYRRVGGS